MWQMGCSSMFPCIVYFGLCFPKLSVPLITALGKADLICFEGTKIEKGDIINVLTAAPALTFISSSTVFWMLHVCPQAPGSRELEVLTLLFSGRALTEADSCLFNSQSPLLYKQKLGDGKVSSLKLGFPAVSVC